MPVALFRRLPLFRSVAFFLVLLSAVFLAGCGDNQDEFVFTNTSGAASGSVTFLVPAVATSLDIEFFSGPDQTGDLTREVVLPSAASVTASEVPITTQSFRVTARDAEGLPLRVSRGAVSVTPAGTVTVDLATVTTTDVTLNTVTVLPATASIAVGATQQFSATGQFSNGESLPLPSATFTSSNTGIAGITATGLATGNTAGAVTITGTFNTVTDDAALTVTSTPVAAGDIDVIVSNNGAANMGDLDLFDRLSALVRTFDSGNNQGVVLDKLGVAYHNGDDPNDSVRIISRFVDRTGAFNPVFDREVTSAAFTAIKGSAFSQERGFLVLADAADAQLHVLGTSGTAVQSVTTPGGNPWDAAYDDANDRLYVAFTNGDIGVFDNWFAGGFFGTATRTIDPVGGVNLHGISFDPVSNTLVVSDVGDAASATDGQIFVIPNASTASGPVTPSATIAGDQTQLGNPVDIDLRNGDLRVAEKSNDRLLTFTDILGTIGGNFAAAVSVTELKPESVTSVPRVTLEPDTSDIDGGITVQSLLCFSNPGGLASPLRIAPDLSSSTTLALSVSEPESLRVDGQGDTYLTRDNGFGVAGRLGANVRDSVTATPIFDRDSVFLTGMKGLDVVDSRGLVIIARTGTPSLLVFSKTNGNRAAVFTTPTTATPWDVDYDPGNDRLYVANTNGTVTVYDNYLDGADPNTAVPNRTITPAGSVNLHGITHDAVNNVLLLSDVGDAASTTDGQLFVVANASTANGAVTPTVTIGGLGTFLGNPVDIEYDGTNLYVAEKSNDRVMRFNNIRTSVGGEIAPSASITVNKPESISLVVGL